MIDVTTPMHQLKNWIANEWTEPRSTDAVEITNPASGEVIGEAPMASLDDVDDAVQAAQDAFDGWRRTPAVDRARLLFRLQALVEENLDELARTVTIENGKTLEESRGEVLRTLENIEVAAGIPSLQMGQFSADIARDIDEAAVREPMGVFAQIGPFNFPSMVPFWFAPYALATGNTYVIKPSPQTPLSQTRMMELVQQAGFPSGVINLVHGGADQAEALVTHSLVRGISFVGTTRVARRIYELAGLHGKRVQAQGGAMNHLVIMPDANLAAAIPNLMGSTFGCAGQRCLAGSVVVAQDDIYAEFRERLGSAAGSMRLGDGLDPVVDMGPVISADAQTHIISAIDEASASGATLVNDGRGATAEGLAGGYWVGPTVVDDVTPDMRLMREEIFGPVVSLRRAGTLHEAIDMIDASPFGNAASIYTSSGAAAREFAARVNIGNVGINVGVAAPMAFFPFAGRKSSFFGDLHGQAGDAVRFFTDPKVIVSRWPGSSDGRDPWD